MALYIAIGSAFVLGVICGLQVQEIRNSNKDIEG
jgi:hypothetical protein